MITKRIIIVIFICAGLLLVWWFIRGGHYTITNLPSRGTTIVAFGDSLIEGVGATEGNDFVSMLSRNLNISIINAGRSGDTTELALARIESDVLAYDPKVVLVLLGGNDFLKRVPKEQMLGNLTTIISAIQNRGAIVLLLGIRGGLFTDAYEKDLKALAERTGSAYVPNVLKGLLGDTDYMDDAIHPNNAGYARIAERVEPILKNLIQ